jgi:hypothetical protein
MNELGKCLQDLADASNSHSDAIDIITKRLDALEAENKELKRQVHCLENPEVCGNGAGHYGAGPWG